MWLTFYSFAGKRGSSQALLHYGRKYLGKVVEGIDIGEFKCELTGSVYVGQFKRDAMHGLGVMTESGVTYAGSWSESNRSGYGECIYANGGIYRGQWENGKCQGYGEDSHPNGELYLGQYDQSMRHGMGRCISKTGTLFSSTRIEDTIWDKNRNTGVSCDASFIVQGEKGEAIG